MAEVLIWMVKSLLLILPVMGVTFLACRAVRNFGFVDAVWALSFPLVAWAGFLLDRPTGSRVGLFLLLVSIWGMRLGGYLLVRAWRHHPVEDRRYAFLRESWKDSLDLKMFGFFMVQGVSVALLSLPAWVVLSLPDGPAGTLQLVAMGLFVLALAGESLADWQLARFKSQHSGQGRVCEAGLWSWSRHPNYFFEWLIWVSLALYASASTFSWLAWVAPVLILHFLLNVTGIPETERLLVASRGEAYRDYQRRVSRFFPMKPQRPSLTA